MPQETYALSLPVAGRRVVVVGAGQAGTPVVRRLLAAGAAVLVVAPEASPEVREAASAGLIDWLARPYRSGDATEAWLVHAAAGDAEVDALVAADAERAGTWCVVEQPEPSTSAATAPVGRAGKVALVGGGPGAADLITVRGLALLAEADVVVVDRLAPRALLDDLSPGVHIVDVGKSAGDHPVPQHEINAVLVDRALAGKRVVRLKGGDPYVFGRGGEEHDACVAAGVPVEVVPGVTSAVSVPAAAGIPVTHRGVARGFSVLTGHDDAGRVPTSGDHTLVLLMGLARLERTCAELIARGHDPHCPAAVIEDGFGPRQRTTVATLATIAARAREMGVRPPAVAVVGDVVRRSPAWACAADRALALAGARAYGAEGGP